MRGGQPASLQPAAEGVAVNAYHLGALIRESAGEFLPQWLDLILDPLIVEERASWVHSIRIPVCELVVVQRQAHLR